MALTFFSILKFSFKCATHKQKCNKIEGFAIYLHILQKDREGKYQILENLRYDDENIYKMKIFIHFIIKMDKSKVIKAQTHTHRCDSVALRILFITFDGMRKLFVNIEGNIF